MPGIPFHTSTITVKRLDEDSAMVDGYDALTGSPRVVAQNVRAVISTPSASTHLNGGERITYNASMRCDPCDMQADDTITASDGTSWKVLNVVPQGAFGLKFLIGSLRFVEGASA